MTQLPMIQLITFGFTFWFGAYLLTRHQQKVGMRYAGLGLMVYAVGLAGDTLLVSMNNPILFEQAVWFRRVWVILPAICWFITVRELYLASQQASLPRRPIGLIFIATIFFALAVVSIIVPQRILTTDVAYLAISVDVILLGYGISALDAFEDGEVFFPDFLRALIGTGFVTLVLSGQVALFTIITGTSTPATLLLLTTIIATSILIHTFSNSISDSLDNLIFGKSEAVEERTQLRAMTQAIPRFDNSLDINTLADKEFNRLTRRALSNMGNLTKLASSPLSNLPIVHQRLAEKGQSDNTLDRANELKLVLTESIERLKPPHGDFGTTDEWRYYNALYFPYVVGIKPFSRRHIQDDLDEATRDALDWFQAYVPERTLYNWQTAASKLIAQDLREQVTAIVPPNSHPATYSAVTHSNSAVTGR